MSLSARRMLSSAAAAMPAAATAAKSSSWDIVAAVLLSRRPLIAPPMSPIEEKFQRMLLEREQAASLLGDFELKTKQDEKLEARRKELMAAGRDLSELEGQLGVTNAMRIDEWRKHEAALRERLKAPQPVADPKSGARLPDRRITLLVKQRFGSPKYASPWILPQTKHQGEESLRETAERCLATAVKGAKTSEIPNAPYAMHTYKYPKALRDNLKSEAIGAKLFFFATDLISDAEAVSMEPVEIAEHAWCAPEELASYLTRQYRNRVSVALVE